MNQNPPDNATEPRSVDQQQACSPIASLAAALLDSGNVMVIGDGCSTRSRDLWILTDIIGRHLEPKKPKCPHCGSGLLWSEDRGAHCDGCDDFNPETDLENTKLTT